MITSHIKGSLADAVPPKPTFGAQTVYAIILVSFIADGLTTILYNLSFPYWKISLLYRSLLEVLILAYFAARPQSGLIYTLLTFFVLTFTIGHLALRNEYSDLDTMNAYQNVLKYLFVFVLLLPFLEASKDSRFPALLKKAMNYFFLVNNTAIFLGVIFQIDIFSSYFNPAIEHTWKLRFGYKGFINAQNEVTGVYLFGIAFYFREYFRRCDSNGILRWSTFIAALCTGTKGGIIAALVLTAYYMLRYRRRKTVRFYLPLGLAILFFWGITLWDYIYQEYFYTFKYFIEDREVEWLTFMLSFRDILIEETIAFMRLYWNWVTAFFGGGDAFHVNTETDIMDGYLVFGLFFIPYLIYLTRIILSCDRSKDQLFVYVLFLILAATGGHLITSVIVSSFMLVYVFSFGAPTGAFPFTNRPRMIHVQA